MRQHNRRFSTGFLIPDFRAYRFGIFVLESWSNDKFTLETGARYDYRRVRIYPNSGKRASEQVLGGTHTYNNFTGSIGGIYKISPTVAAAVNIGRAWRPPGVNELYSYGVHHGTAQFEIGDRGLESESSLNSDFTMRYLGERGRAEISFFRSQFDNYISLLPAGDLVLTIRGAFPKFAFVQTDAVIKGFDGYLEYSPTDYMDVYLSASLIRGRDTKQKQPLYQMPPARLISGLGFHLPPSGRLLEASVRFENSIILQQKNFPKNLDYVDPPPGYKLFDMHLSGKFAIADQPVRAQLGVHNLFNTRYRDYLSRFRYFIDNPGRNFTFSLSMPFGKFKE